MRVRHFFGLGVSICVMSLVPTAFAQLPPVSSTTSTPVPGAGHDYLGALSETVNPANGSVSLRLPVVMPPSRGITLPFSFAYDSNGVNYLSLPPGSGATIAQWLTSFSVISGVGWSDSVPLASFTQKSWTTTSDTGTKITCYTTVNFVFQDGRGNRHNLGLTSYSDPGGTGPCTYNTADWPVGFDGLIITQGGRRPYFGKYTDWLDALPVSDCCRW